MSRALLALLIILLAAPIEAGSPFGGFHGPASHHGFPVFHHRGSRARRFFGGYVCGYDCGWDDSGGYDYGYGYDDNYAGSSGNGYRNGFGGGAGNAVSVSNGLPGGYVPDPVGADIPPLIIPHNCWVRRAAYDPSGAYFGQVLVNQCRPSDRATVTGSKARAAPDKGAEPAQSAPADRSSSPEPPH